MTTLKTSTAGLRRRPLSSNMTTSRGPTSLSFLCALLAASLVLCAARDANADPLATTATTSTTTKTTRRLAVADYLGIPHDAASSGGAADADATARIETNAADANSAHVEEDDEREYANLREYGRHLQDQLKRHYEGRNLLETNPVFAHWWNYETAPRVASTSTSTSNRRNHKNRGRARQLAQSGTPGLMGPSGGGNKNKKDWCNADDGHVDWGWGPSDNFINGGASKSGSGGKAGGSKASNSVGGGGGHSKGGKGGGSKGSYSSTSGGKAGKSGGSKGAMGGGGGKMSKGGRVKAKVRAFETYFDWS